MHQNLVFLGDDNFIKIFNELKSFFKFKYKTQHIKDFKEINNNSVYILLFQDLKSMNVAHDKNVIILKTKDNKITNYANIIIPCSIFELQNKILNNLTSKKFQANTKIQVRDYFLDINSRLLIKSNYQLKLTEKESRLIEILSQAESPLTKEQLIKSIWNYSSDTETHTMETHIYRLRKKISDKFNDENFILTSDQGYYI